MPKKKLLATLELMPMKTLEEFDIAILTLAQVRDQARTKTLPYPGLGICGGWTANLKDYTRVAVWWSHDSIRYVSADWSKSAFPGVFTSYPVPDDGEYSLWDGPNLKARIHLINYTLRRLRGFRAQLVKQQNQKDSTP